MLGWLEKTAKQVRDAATETLEGIGEDVAGALVGAVSIPPKTTTNNGKTQVDVGDNGTGGTVVQPTPTGVVGGMTAGLPSWAVPVSLTVAGLTVATVVAGLVIGGRKK